MADEGHRLDVVPNFDAFERWIGKLKGWCEAAVHRIEELEQNESEQADEIRDLEDKVSELESEGKDYDELAEAIADVGRGIRTWDEVKEMVRE